jgi:rare lipoprotein A
MSNQQDFAHSLLQTKSLVSETFQETLGELRHAAIVTRSEIQTGIRASAKMLTAAILFSISSIFSIGATVGEALASSITASHAGHHPTAKHYRRGFRHHLKLTKSDKLAVRQAAEVSETRSTHRILGVASWYGGKFQHRKTASGSTFETHDFTAAHRSLPFGTKVRVTNLRNHKSCVVEVTDRGPYVQSRDIDVSRAAAEELDFASLGTAHVSLEVLPNANDELIASLYGPLASGVKSAR